MKDYLTEYASRTKLSHDPNNTAWIRSSTTYGKKILQSHGWMPGTFLGARDANCSVSSSVASLPHFKVVLKDNSHGLGARDGANCGNGKCTGLDVFQGILGRLNGQNEPQFETQGNCSDYQMKNIHQESRTGAIQFVSGGFLEGTRQDEPMEEQMMKPICFNEGSLLKGDDDVQQVQTQLEYEDKTPIYTKPSNPCKHKNSRKRRARGNQAVANGSKVIGKENGRCNIPDDRGHHKKKSSPMIDSDPLELRTAARQVDEEERNIKSRIERELEQTVLAEKRKALVDVPAGFLQETQSPNPFTPLTVFRSRTSQPLEGRHAVRQRHIRQMKMAITDSKALNEVSRVLRMCEV